MKPTVLVVDDKPNMLAMCAKLLGPICEVVTARTVHEALAKLDEHDPAVVVCDLRMPDGDGLTVLRGVQARRPGLPFILMTAYATVPTAVQAMREGAFDYVTKPFDPDAMRAQVERALAVSRVQATSAAPAERQACGDLISSSPLMADVFQLVQRVAPTDATVLILGETGTGKELVARAVHELSKRAHHRMVAVNCAALPPSLLDSELFGHVRGSFTGANADRAGLFESATGGTVFLDEVGELTLEAQAKLTRVLEQRTVRRIGDSRERPIDVRLVAATHRDLAAMVAAGSFRQDLLFRLKVCPVRVPPLRERPEDIPVLAEHFLATDGPKVGATAKGIAREALAAMAAYTWPGNVRELRGAVERAAIVERTEEIQPSSLPEEVYAAYVGSRPVVPPADLGELTFADAVEGARDEATQRYVEAILRRFEGNVAAAAAHAGIERESLYRLMRRYAITAQAFRPEPGSTRRS